MNDLRSRPMWDRKLVAGEYDQAADVNDLRSKLTAAHALVGPERLFGALAEAAMWVRNLQGDGEGRLAGAIEASFARWCGLSHCRLTRHDGNERTAEGVLCRPGEPSGFIVPFRDRKRYLLGRLTAGVPAWQGEEASATVALAEVLATKAGEVLDTERTLRISSRLVAEVSGASDPAWVLQAILDRAAELTRADRGELARMNWKEEDLFYRSKFPREDPHGPAVGGRVPQYPSLIRWAWDNNKPEIIPDVNKEKDKRYHPCDPRTRSELVIPLSQQLRNGNRRLGVLNLESFELSHFDAQDLEAVSEMARQAIDQSAHVRRHIDFDEVIGLLSSRRPDAAKIAQSVLKSIRRNHGFDQGLVYRYDWRTRMLVAYAAIGIDLKAKPIAYRISDRALASKVFRDRKHVFSPNPWTDPDVSRLGVEQYDIHGGLLGMPLEIEAPDGQEGESRMVGVLVVWSKHRKINNPSPCEDDRNLLRPFCRIAALALNAAEVQQRHDDYRKQVGGCLHGMQQTMNARRNVEQIVEAIRKLGFERVRVFQMRHGYRLQPYAWSGMELYESVLQYWRGYREPQDAAEQDAYVPWTRANPYVGRLFSGQESADLFARLYPAGGLADPDGERIGKSPALQWISVPLVSAGRTYGELAVDNLGTGRPFTNDDLEYLTFFAALAARAFAMEEKEGMLIPRTVAELYRAVDHEPRDWVVRRRLLLYLTHAEEGLGFSRALLLQHDHTTGDFRVKDAVGPLDEASARRQEREQRHCRLSEFLATASRPGDRSLEDAARPVRIPASNDIASYWSKIAEPVEEDCSRPGAANWMRELGQAIGADKILIAPVRVGGANVGLFVVDRRWSSPATLTQADQAALGTFAQLAQMILQSSLQGEALKAAEYVNLGMVSKTLIHQIRHPLEGLHLCLGALKRKAARGSSEAMALTPVLTRVEESAKELTALVEKVQALARPADAAREADLEPLVRKVCRHHQEFHEGRPPEIEFRLSFEGNLSRLVVIEGLLEIALDNLLSNARAALADTTDRTGAIDLDVECTGHDVLFRVTDNGVGIADWHLLERYNRRDTNTTTRPGRGGLGFGLAIVHRVADHHGGEFSLSSKGDNLGTVATLRIPVKRKDSP